jgi:hypothetical protein
MLVSVHEKLVQQRPGQLLGEHDPNRSHTPPALLHEGNEVIEQPPLVLLQHEPMQGLGAQVVPPTNNPPPAAH